MVLKAHLLGLHVENLLNLALHDQEVGIVDIQLDGAKEVLDLLVLHQLSIDQELVLATDYHLAGHGNLPALLISLRALGGIGIIENNGHRSLCNARLSIFVDQVLQS